LKKVVKCRSLVQGEAYGEALVSKEPISFYGGIDPESGRVVERGHPLEGKAVSGKVLFFPYGKGSTVGSYIIYRLAKKGLAPLAIVNVKSEPIIVIGCVLSSIPLVDGFPVKYLDVVRSGSTVRVIAEENEAIVVIEV